MKKLMIVIMVLIASIGVRAQFNPEGVNVTAYDTLRTENVLEIGGDILNSTTQMTVTDTTLGTKDYIDSKAAGLDSIMDIDSDYICKIYLNGLVVDSFQVDSTYHSIYSDSSKFADNSSHSDTATVALNTAKQSVYTITLAGTGSVQDRIDASTEGTDYPTGWTLTADVFNIVITHGQGRWVADVKVQAKTGGTVRSNLKDTNAYANFDCLSDDQIKIYTLSTDEYPIVIYLIFE